MRQVEVHVQADVNKRKDLLQQLAMLASRKHGLLEMQRLAL
ncbi:MAG: hypothetical protein ABSF46_27555 [Terriglobia bacterium]